MTQLTQIKVINSFTCMLVNHNFKNKRNESEMKVIGTGVFIHILNRYFLVSASHVFDDYENLQIPIEKHSSKLMHPGGTTYINRSDDRNKDFIDIGFLELDQASIADILITYKFANEENILLDHRFENQPYYTFLGYPTTLSKISQSRNSFHSVPFFHMSTPANNIQYTKLNRDSTVNIITSYDKRKSFLVKSKSFGTGPDLHGISGCGLWFTDPMNVFANSSKPKLVAIMTDWPIKDRTKIIGTRIDIVIKSITSIFNTV